VSTPRIGAAGGELGHRLVRALSAARSSRAASEAVLREIAHTLDSPIAVLWLLDEQSGLLRWQQDWASGDELDELRGVVRRLTFAPGVGLLGAVVERLEPAWAEDVGTDPNFPRADVALRAGMRSVIAAPVVSPDGVTGVMEFFGRTPHAPTAEQVEDVTMGGRQLAAYLGRLRIEDRLRASEESSASIVQAALDCIVTMDHRGRVIDFNPAAEATFGYEREAVIGELLADLIIPPQLREAHARALSRFVQDRAPTILGQRLELLGMRADGSTLPVELTVTRLGTREPPVFAGFIRDITDRRELEAEQSRLLRAALLARAQAEAAEVRTDDAREEAERTRADAERARERMAFLARAGREMAESLDWERTLEAVVRSAVPAIADWSALTVAAPAGVLRVVAVAHNDPEREKLAWEFLDRYPQTPDAASGPTHVIRTGEPEVRADITPEAIRAVARDPEHLRLLENLNVRHTAIVPLKTPDRVIGALSFVLGDSDRRFSDEDLQLITTLAARAALQIQNAWLYTERSNIAETLQASLRPRALPIVPGADIAARFLPAGDQNEVGGDFYDVFRSGDGAWTAIVGDVSGKGADAAAITALARHTLRAASMLHDDPAANLALLNRALNEDTMTLDFCTVFYARLCPGDTGIDFRFSNGGHPAPLLLRVDGTVDSIESGRGPLVGALEDADFHEATLHLSPGELLLMYTDGVTEIRTSDVEFGERELRATLAAHAGASADAVVAAVQQHAVELQGGAPRDDIALVAIKARGDGAGPEVTVAPWT
jgi:PAS domain S-box-containing protein